MLAKFVSAITKFFTEGHERTLLAKRNIFFSFFLRGLSILVGFLYVPITIHYLGTEDYGIWLTLSSIFIWLFSFDIGLGNGLKNKLAETTALNNYESGKIYVSTTYALLTLIVGVIFCGFIIINYFLNWQKILNTHFVSGINLNLFTDLVFLLFCIQFISQIMNVILTANHKITMVSFLNFLGQFASLVGVFLLTKFSKSSLLLLVLVSAGLPILIQIFSSIWFFSTSLKDISPGIKYINLKHSKELLSTGLVFFLVQIGGVVLFQTDNIIISHLYGPSQVTIFNIDYKLFSALSIAFLIVINPFWTAFTDAYVKKDFIWIKGIFRKFYDNFYLVILISLFILVLSPFFIKIWIGNSVKISISLSISLTVYIILYCWLFAHCFFLNGVGKIKIQLYLYVVGSILNIPLAVFLARFFGVNGVVFSNIFVMLVMSIVLYIQCNKIANQKAIGIWNA